MPNLAKTLKDEIARIARKEAKLAVAPLHKPTAGARHTFADLKRRVETLEKENKRLAVVMAKAPQQPPASETTSAPSTEQGSISGKEVRSLRQSLGLSQAAFAKLLKVGYNTVYKWESKPGMLQLRDKTRAALMAARKKGARATQATAPQPQPAPAVSEAPSKGKGWISGKGVRSLRLSLGLSHQEFAKLLGVGHNTTYKWESKPGMLPLRDNTKAALMAARQMGAREAKAKLAEMKPAKKAQPVAKRGQ